MALFPNLVRVVPTTKPDPVFGTLFMLWISVRETLAKCCERLLNKKCHESSTRDPKPKKYSFLTVIFNSHDQK